MPQEGIADLSFQLSDEPLLGTYVINVTNRKIYDSFTVEEYGMSAWGICMKCRDAFALYSRNLSFYFMITILWANEESNNIIEKSLSWCPGEGLLWDLQSSCRSNSVQGPRPLTQLIPVDGCIRQNKVTRVGFSREYEVQCHLFYHSLINSAGKLLQIAVWSWGIWTENYRIIIEL